MPGGWGNLEGGIWSCYTGSIVTYLQLLLTQTTEFFLEWYVYTESFIVTESGGYWKDWLRESKTYTYININKTETLLVVKKRLRQRLDHDKIDLQIQLNIIDIE